MVWIDTDMGFDDIQAILMVDHSRFDIAGVSLVFGNAPMAQVRRNASRAKAFFGWNFPIFAGAHQSVLGKVETPIHVLGPQGMPTRGRILPEAPELEMTPALAALAEWLEGLEEPGRILALGPLTNIAILALARPDLRYKIGAITWMGGGATRGNHTPSAEFNAFADPEALAIVLANDLPLRVADLDLCRQVQITPQDVEDLAAANTERSKLLADLLGGFLDIAISRGRPSMSLYDPTAAAAFIAPNAFQFKPAFVSVELASEKSRGRTIVDQREGVEANVSWGMRADAERVRALALEAIAEACFE
ncbi:nucleoside hydrolase [Nitratireductor basaltis]|uniref:Inosine-uridine preferring nucleoside hydrolase protein n=1 Tax=Nitratireductor basaltis TaxID=472175 RepID=A0A084U500_9HYPH|nr:nucleoside hydrolase [Nitratireductor basaltis]KFB08036.1 Inosine-uridine preferring nucleoside hydrolase protein [Nitratireductor basaltis]